MERLQERGRKGGKERERDPSVQSSCSNLRQADTERHTDRQRDADRKDTDDRRLLPRVVEAMMQVAESTTRNRHENVEIGINAN